MGRRRSERPLAMRSRTELGQALAEFAIVAPVMFLIFAAAAQFAIIFERQIGIENAVRDGARRAATWQTATAAQANTNGPVAWYCVFGTGGLMQSNVQGYDGLAIANAAVTYTDQTDSSGLTSVRVTVSVTYKHPLFLPLITQIIDNINSPPEPANDNTFWITTSSSFTVQNDATANATAGGVPPFTAGSSC